VGRRKEDPIGQGRERRTLSPRGEIGLSKIKHDRDPESLADGPGLQQLPRNRGLMKDRLPMDADEVASLLCFGEQTFDQRRVKV
jgi:hypothetical protein